MNKGIFSIYNVQGTYIIRETKITSLNRRLRTILISIAIFQDKVKEGIHKEFNKKNLMKEVTFNMGFKRGTLTS